MQPRELTWYTSTVLAIRSFLVDRDSYVMWFAGTAIFRTLVAIIFAFCCGASTGRTTCDRHWRF